MTQPARPLKIFTTAVVFQNGPGANNNYRNFFFLLLNDLDFTLIHKIKFSCLGHVVNPGNVDIMKHITKIAVVENATTIWEYDPSRDDNHVLGGSLDVIAAIQTLAIKVC